MQWLLESPWPTILFGALVLLLLAVAFFQTRRGALVVAMAGVVVAVSLGLLVEWLVVTEREAVEDTLYEVAEALESNDVQRVKGHLAPEATFIRQKAEQLLPPVEIEEAHVGGPEITINRFGGAPTATAKFLGRIVYHDRSGTALYDNFISEFTVKLRHDGQRWLLTGYVDGTTSTQFE